MTVKSLDQDTRGAPELEGTVRAGQVPKSSPGEALWRQLSVIVVPREVVRPTQESMVLTIDVAVLLAVIIVVRLRRRVQARSRSDQTLTVAIVLVFGVMIAPTAFGQGVLHVTGQLAQGITQSGSP
jgi:hypothetical protein